MLKEICYSQEIEIEKRDIQDNSIEAIFANIKMIKTVGDDGKMSELDFEITFDANLYTLLRAHYDAQSFDKLKEEKQLSIDFEQFPEEVATLLNNSQNKFSKKSPKRADPDQIENAVYFVTTNETSGYLIFLDILSFKEVEIFRIDFTQVADEESHLSAQQKFTKVKNDLKKQTLMLKTLYKEIKSQCPFILELIRRQ